jgi:transcription initiation factor TFIID subunit 2
VITSFSLTYTRDSYFEIIKNPMDISTMTAKLEAGMYKERFAFEADFRLMIRNAKTYNMPGTFAYSETLALESVFDKSTFTSDFVAWSFLSFLTGWARINNTIDMKSANQPKPMAPPPVPIQAKTVVVPKTPAAPVAPTAVQTSTPSLKLKIGGNFTPRATPPAPSNGAAVPKPVITVKPKAKKPKPVDPTPASVVDDGSFDLLEEVIAIEKEKEKLVAKKQRPFTTSPEAPAPAKRKKDLLDELEDDDEILALASPSKKPSKSPQPSTIEKEWRAISPAKFTGSIKIKKPPIPIPEHAPSPEVKPPAEIRQQPTKGKDKEKEVVPQASSRASVSETPLNKARAREVLKILLKLPEAAIFSRPVDPIQDGCPTYTFYSPIYSTRADAILPTDISTR